MAKRCLVHCRHTARVHSLESERVLQNQTCQAVTTIVRTSASLGTLANGPPRSLVTLSSPHSMVSHYSAAPWPYFLAPERFFSLSFPLWQKVCHLKSRGAACDHRWYSDFHLKKRLRFAHLFWNHVSFFTLEAADRHVFVQAAAPQPSLQWERSTWDLRLTDSEASASRNGCRAPSTAVRLKITLVIKGCVRLHETSLP